MRPQKGRKQRSRRKAKPEWKNKEWKEKSMIVVGKYKSELSLKSSQRTNSSRQPLSNEGSGCVTDGSRVEVVRDFGWSWEQAGSDLGGSWQSVGKEMEGVVRDM